jgi:Putative Ig domain
MNFATRATWALIAGTALFALWGCGGGGGTAPPPPPPPPNPNPAPHLTSVSPSGAVAGGPGFTLTVNGSGFIAASRAAWNGATRTTTLVNSTRLTADILASDINATGTALVTVTNPSPGGGDSNPVAFSVQSASLTITTKLLPSSSGGKQYLFTLGSQGGISPITWGLAAGSGPLPQGLSLDAAGRISGTLAAVGSDSTSSFTVEARDSGATQGTDTQALSILVRVLGPGRNDSCATATPISNGRLRASLSPYADEDFYAFQGTQGAAVTIETFAQRLDLDGDPLTVDSFADTVVELLNSSCTFLSFNDDLSPGVLDSRMLNFSLPSTGTFFVHVLDYRGDGRPDLAYDLQLSGAN